MGRRKHRGSDKSTLQRGDKKGNKPNLVPRKDNKSTRVNHNNRADQLNPNNDAYWKARKYEERPNDWESRSPDDSSDQK